MPRAEQVASLKKSRPNLSGKKPHLGGEKLRAQKIQTRVKASAAVVEDETKPKKSLKTPEAIHRDNVRKYRRYEGVVMLRNLPFQRAAKASLPNFAQGERVRFQHGALTLAKMGLTHYLVRALHGGNLVTRLVKKRMTLMPEHVRISRELTHNINLPKLNT